MPVKDPLPLTRKQIAEFVGNKHETIRRIERLFEVAGEETPQALEGIEIMAGNALSLVNSMIGEITAYARDTDTNLAVMDAKISEALNKLCPTRISVNPPDNYHHNFSNRDYIDFNISNQTEIDIPGRCLWNIEDGTLNLGLYNEVVLQIGQEQHFYAKNVSGAQIDDGQPVMFAGTIGASGKFEIDLAESDPAIPAEYFMGVSTQDIANNDFGYVTCFGLVRGIDTTGTPVGEVWSDGDLLYLSTTAGELTITPPTSPDPKVLVAAVIYSHATIGSIFVRPTWGNYLSTLHDVYITGVANHDILEYSSANARWENTSDPVVDTITINTSSAHNGDNIPAYFGAGNDMSIDYDGTDGNIDMSLVAASDLLITCGPQKTLELQNHVYKDINIGGLNFGGPVATNPDEVELIDNTGTATGIYSRGFAVGEKVSAIKELQHDYAEGENISFHIHWQGNDAPTGTDNVQWQLTYTVAQGGETLDPVTTLTIETAIDTQYEMYTSVFSTITGTNYKIGDQLCLTLERIAASANEYGGDAVIFTGGTHYPLNTLGSRQIATK